MSAASKHTALAAVSVALIAALAIAGAAVGGKNSKRRDKVPPTAPTNLRLTSATPFSVSLAWDASTDNVRVGGYYVYVEGMRTRISGTSYVAQGLECGQSVNVSVFAYDWAGNPSPAATATVSTAACPDLLAPTPPAGFQQQATTRDTVVLAWDRSTDNVGVVGYGVYRNLLQVEDTSDPNVTLTGLLCGGTYQYVVDAFDAAGNRSARRSAWVQTAACSDGQPPTAPAGLAVTSHTADSLSLAWSASSDNVAVAGYRLSLGSSPVTTVTSTSATISSLPCDTSYTVAVDAYDAAGNRSAAATIDAATDACASPPPPPPPPPSGDTSPPSKPVLALGTKTQTSLVLNWQAASDNLGVDHYNAFRGPSAAPAAQVKVAEATGLTYTYKGLTCGTDYSLALEAEDAAGNKSELAEAIWFPARTLDCTAPPPPPPPPSPAGDTTPPTAPTALAVTAATGVSIALVWLPSTDNVGVTGYGVYRNGTSVSTASLPSALLSGLLCGTAYTLQVDAFDAAGNRSARTPVTSSTSACSDTQPPTAPTNVNPTSRTATSIALSWTPSSDNVGVTAYGLYRAGTAVGTAAATTGIFSNLTCNTNYTLAVDARDAAGNVSAKATVMVATTACPDTSPPSSPTGVAAASVSQTSLTLTWNASSDNVGVTGYDVYRNGTKMATVTSTSSPQTGLACGTSYSFGVIARDAAGLSSPQAQLTASAAACSPPPPPPPTTPQPVGVLGSWNLVFADDFEGPLNTNVWTTCHWWSPDTSCQNVSTSELPCYLPEQAFTSGGELVLRAERRTVSCDGYPLNYVSGMVQSGGNASGKSPGFNYTYGYAEARIKLPPGRGFWPGFWSAAQDHQWPPEIDFAEFNTGAATTWTGNYHYADSTGSHQAANNAWQGPDFTAGYHVFGCEWSPIATNWYVDGVLRASFTNASYVAAEPMYLYLTLSVGGIVGTPDASTPFPADMHIDHVRVWKRA